MGILNVTLGSLNNTTVGTVDGYRDYSCTLGTTLAPGLAYPVSVRTNAGTNENVRAWIDYNNDGVFDPVAELFFASTGARLHTGASVPVPLSATLGLPLRLRVAADGATAAFPTPCSTPLYSQTEDYRVTLAPNTQPPQAAFAVSTAAACTGTFAFADQSLRGPATWRWRFGDGSTSTLPNPAHTYAAPGTYAVTLRVCNANGCDSLTQPAAATFFAANPVPPLCRPATQNYCCGHGIARFQLGSVAYASADGSAGYEDFSCTRRFVVAEAEVLPFRVETGPNAGNVWIYADLNNNGDLGEPGELVWSAAGVQNPEGFLAIPDGALTNRPLRLRVVADAAPGPATPCAPVVRGQVEDYSLVVTPAPCAAAAMPTVQGPIQSSSDFNFPTLNVFFAPAEGTNQRVQWQRAPFDPAVSFADVPGGVAPFIADTYAFNSGAPSYFRARVGCGATAPYSPWQPTGEQPQRTLQAPCAAGRPFIQRVRLLGTTLDHASACANTHGPGYMAYAPDVSGCTATVQGGGAYQLAITTSFPARVSVFADEPYTPAYNGPRLLAQGRSAGAGAPLSLALVFDSVAAARRTGTGAVAYVVLRVRCDALTSAVPDRWVTTDINLGAGETEDYYLAKTPRRCPAAAAAGPLAGWQAPYCPADTVRLQALAPAPGSTLQWQTSPDSLAWADVPGATGLRWQTNTPTSFYVRLRARGCAGAAFSPARRVVVRPYAQCYCQAGAGAPAAAWPLLSRVRVAGTPLDNASPAVPGGPALATYLPTAPAGPAALVRGATYALDLNLLPGPGPAATVVTAWLDTNANGAYDSLEWQPVLRLPPGAAPGTYRAALRVPLNARTDAAGPVGLRLRVGPASARQARPRQACAFGASGETEDYRVALVDAPCGPGPFTAGTLDTLARAPYCAAQPALRVRGYSPGARLQWQRRVGPVSAPWRDLPGATDELYLLPLGFVLPNPPDAYRVRATCGPAADTTAALTDARCQLGCAHVGGVGTSCTGAYLTDVALLGTPLANHGTNCSTSPFPGFSGRFPFTLYPPSVPTYTATLVRGQTYTLSLGAAAPSATTYVNTAAWLDWNADGTYSANEFYRTGPPALGTQQGQATLTVPLTAHLGQVLLRAAGQTDYPEWYNACARPTEAETEFYVLKVVDQPGPGLPVLTAAPQPLCAGGTLQLQATGTGAGAAVSWLGPAGFAATGLAPTLPALTLANGGTYVAATTRNGQRVVSSVYAPVTTCLATRATVAAERLRLFPNPTTGRCTLRLPAGLPPGELAVLLRAPTGQVVARALVPARPATGQSADPALDLGQLPPGLYFVELQVAGQGRYFGKVVRE